MPVRASREPQKHESCVKCGHTKESHVGGCSACYCGSFLASASPSDVGAARPNLRAFVKHLWDECHDGGDFERTNWAAKLDALLKEL